MAAHTLSARALPFLGALLVMLVGRPAVAQSVSASPSAAPATPSSRDAGSAAMDELLARLAGLQQAVDRQSAEIAELRRLVQAATTLPNAELTSAGVPASPPPQPVQAARAPEEPRQRLPELAPAVVDAGGRPGSVKITARDAPH